MTLLQDGLIAFLSAVGVTTLVWIVAGAFFRAGRPAVPGLLLVLPLRGEALAMEADVRELRRLKNRLPGARIVLAEWGRFPPPGEMGGPPDGGLGGLAPARGHCPCRMRPPFSF